MPDRPLPGIAPAQKKKLGGYRPGSGRPRQEKCLRGHSLTDPANVYIGPKGYPFCRACIKIRREGRRASR